MFFFFNDTATTEIYTLSLHDALPIFRWRVVEGLSHGLAQRAVLPDGDGQRALPHGREHHVGRDDGRSEEHTSELQSRQYLVCRLLLEKKKNPLPFLPYEPLMVSITPL